MPTPNMGLVQPAPLVTTGPAYATQQNSDLSLIDAHDHSSGKGVRISQTGIQFTGDLSFQNNTAYYGPTAMAYAQFNQQALPNVGTKVAAVAVDESGNLWFQNGSGTNVQLTSGSTIVSTGTGEYNGFYGNYAGAGPSHGATAYFSAAASEYQFFTDSAATIRAGMLALKYTASQSAAFAFTSLDNAGTKGFAISNGVGSTEFTVTFNPVGKNPETDSTFRIRPLGFNSMYGMGLNLPSGGAPVTPIDMNLLFSGQDTPAEYLSFTVRGTSTPLNNFGIRMRFNASNTSGATAAAYMQGALTSFWNDASNRYGGLRLFGARQGTINTTPAIEIASNSSGAPKVGIGTAAADTAMLTVGTTGGNLAINALGKIQANDTIQPDATNTRDLGTTSLQFKTIHGVQGRFTGFITPASTADLSIRGSNNEIVSWGQISGAGAKVSGYNCTSVHTATGVYTIDFAFTLVSANYAVVATAIGGATSYVVTVDSRTTAGFKVYVNNLSGTPTDVAFDFMILGMG